MHVNSCIVDIRNAYHHLFLKVIFMSNKTNDVSFAYLPIMRFSDPWSVNMKSDTFKANQTAVSLCLLKCLGVCRIY